MSKFKEEIEIYRGVYIFEKITKDGYVGYKQGYQILSKSIRGLKQKINNMYKRGELY